MYLNRIYTQINKYINVSPYYCIIYILFGWRKSSFKFFILQKNPNELSGRPNILHYIILYYIVLYLIDLYL